MRLRHRLQVIRQYEIPKRYEKTMLWVARHLIPDELAKWSFIVYGSARIYDTEEVPAVLYTTLIGREPRK